MKKVPNHRQPERTLGSTTFPQMTDEEMMARVRRIAERERSNPRHIPDMNYFANDTLLISTTESVNEGVVVKAKAYEGRWRY